MNQDPFKEYLKQTESDKRDKSYVWHTAIGLQAVDGLKPSKYLRSLGFEATNDIFAENAWYFRNALVRANYNDLTKSIHETTKYLELFLENLLCDKHHELHNRTLHVRNLNMDQQKAEEKANIETEKANIEAGKVNIETRKANIDISEIYGDAVKGLSVKTVSHIQCIFHAFGEDSVFGRADIQKETGLGNTRASALLRDLANKQIIVAVSGHGKGKYRFAKKV